VKDTSGNPVANAIIHLINQGDSIASDDVNAKATSSNSTSGWSKYVSSGTYLLVAYNQNNSTSEGVSKPHIVVS